MKRTLSLPASALAVSAAESDSVARKKQRTTARRGCFMNERFTKRTGTSAMLRKRVTRNPTTNNQHPTTNLEDRIHTARYDAPLGVGRWMFDVGGFPATWFRPRRAGPPSNLRIFPAPPIFSVQQPVRFVVADDFLLLAVPADAAPQLVTEHSEQAHVGRALDGFDVAHRPFAGSDGLQKISPEFLDILIVRLVQFRVFVNDRLLVVRRVKGPAFGPTLVERALGAVKITADIFALLGVVTGKLTMLPAHREMLELKYRHLMVGGVAGLFLLVQDGRAFDRPAAGREDSARPFLVQDPKDLIHPVNTPIAERAVGVVEVVAKSTRVNAPVPRGVDVAAVERSQRRGAAPHLPVEFLRRLDVFARRLGSAAVMDEGADHADLAGLAGTDELATRNIVRRNAAVRADLHHAVVLARGIHHRAAFLDRVADRFLHVNVRAVFHRFDHDEGMPMVRRGHDANLRFLFVEQFAKILVRLRVVARFLLHSPGRSVQKARVHIA